MWTRRRWCTNSHREGAVISFPVRVIWVSLCCLSTFETCFSGKKELFTGLAIDELEKKWQSFPILHIDLNTEKYDSADALKSRLNLSLSEWKGLYGSRSSLDFGRQGNLFPKCQFILFMLLFKMAVNFSTDKKIINNWKIA